MYYRKNLFPLFEQPFEVVLEDNYLQYLMHFLSPLYIDDRVSFHSQPQHESLDCKKGLFLVQLTTVNLTHFRPYGINLFRPLLQTVAMPADQR